MVQIRRIGPKRSEHVCMQKGPNFTIVCTMVLIGLNIKFYEIFAKQHVYHSLFFLSNFPVTKSRLSLSNIEIVCADRVKL